MKDLKSHKNALIMLRFTNYIKGLQLRQEKDKNIKMKDSIFWLQDLLKYKIKG